MDAQQHQGNRIVVRGLSYSSVGRYPSMSSRKAQSCLFTRCLCIKHIIRHWSGDMEPRDAATARKIMRSCIVVCVAYFLLFCSVMPVALLQSTMNTASGLGTLTLSLTFGTVILSCTCLPPLILYYLGSKWAMVASFAGFLLWEAAQFYPSWSTLIPASVVMGLSWAPLWTAQSDYYTSLGVHLAELRKSDVGTMLNNMFGAFFMLLLTGPVWGNMISSAMLGSGTTDTSNQTDVPSNKSYSHCGVNYCPQAELASNTSGHSADIPKHLVWTLLGVYIICACVGLLLIALFVDPASKILSKISKDSEQNTSLTTKDEEPATRGSVLVQLKRLALSTGKQLIKRNQLLLIPLTVYIGLQSSFIMAEYSHVFLACSLGVASIGYTLLALCIAGAVTSAFSGIIADHIGRAPVLITGGLTHLAMLIVCLTWTPSQDQFYLFYIIPAVWGVGDGIFQSQTNALYGLLFADTSEAAFTNYRLWEAVGFLIGYGYASFLCTYVKIYVAIVVVIVAMTTYLTMEIILLRQGFNKQETEIDVHSGHAGHDETKTTAL